MIELLIVMAATLTVFMFLLAVLYLHNRRKQKRPHIHTCSNCTCDKRTDPASGNLKQSDARPERIAALSGHTEADRHSS